jgi:hypothetical protein
MTTIDVAAQFGGIDASEAIRPHFWALKAALKDRSFAGFPFPELTFILRVDGQVQTFGGSGVENLKFDRKRQWVSVDIVISAADWVGRDTSDVSNFIANAIVASVDLMRERGGRRLEQVDWDALRLELGAFSAAYKECEMTAPGHDR